MREPWSDIGRAQSDIRDIQNALGSKADDHQIHEANRRLDSLEHTLREISASVDGLRHELEASQDRIRELEGVQP